MSLNVTVWQAKPKKAAWQKVVDQGITPVEAQKKYVELVEQLKSTYGFDPDKAKQAAGNKAWSVKRMGWERLWYVVHERVQ